LALLRRLDCGATARPLCDFDLTLKAKIARDDRLFLAVLSTMVKIRFFLAFDTPSVEANFEASFTGNDSVIGLDIL